MTAGTERVSEDFFGWGQGEYDAVTFRRENCEGTADPAASSCTPCKKAKGKYKLVIVPNKITFSKDRQIVETFIASHNDSYTIFEMESSICDTSPYFSNFEHSREWFRAKYWKKHFLPSVRNSKRHVVALYGSAKNSGSAKELAASSGELSGAPLNFNDNELSIAVHVRRGDFLIDKKRILLKSKLYAQVVRTAQDVVEEVGGKLARLPVAVYIFSEGKPRAFRSERSYTTHDIDDLSSDYIDENGVVRDTAWWTELVQRTTPQREGRPASRQGKPVKVPRVELRISQPTLQTLHQMIRADIFIGSVSGLSFSLVRHLTRGVGIYPQIRSSYFSHCCSVKSDTTRGYFNRTDFARHWRRYAKDNVKYL